MSVSCFRGSVMMDSFMKAGAPHSASKRKREESERVREVRSEK